MKFEVLCRCDEVRHVVLVRVDSHANAKVAEGYRVLRDSLSGGASHQECSQLSAESCCKRNTTTFAPLNQSCARNTDGTGELCLSNFEWDVLTTAAFVLAEGLQAFELRSVAAAGRRFPSEN